MLASVLAYAFCASVVSGTTEPIEQRGAHPEFVQKVKSGEFTRARASWWGWNGDDDTVALQAAIDSGVKTLIIDRMDGPWNVRPIKMPLVGRTVVFEDGTVVQARRGDYHGIRDSLIDLSGSTNAVLTGKGATLRMWREDYIKPPYARSEWRYALCVYRCRGVRVEGLHIEDSGGDGIVVAGAAKDVTIRGVTSLRNHRQGISVIDAEGLLIEDCDLIHTGGTAPSAGIDFEPDGGHEMLKDIVMRRCRLNCNAGAGVQVCLNQQSDRSAPISILIEDCQMVSNDCGTVVIMNRTGNYPTGEVRYRRCTFADEKGAGIRFEKKPAFGTAIVFEKCTVKNACMKDPAKPDVLFTPIQWNEELPGSIDFGDLTIRQSQVRPWIGVVRPGFNVLPSGLKGEVRIVAPDGAENMVSVDDAWAKKTFPLPPGPQPVPQFVGDFRKVRLVDEMPEKRVELPPVRAWSNTFYRYYVNRPRRVVFVMHQEPPHGGPARHLHIWTSQIYGKFSTILQSPGTNATEVAFEAPQAGWYMMGVMPLGSYFALDAADVPIAISTYYGAPMCRVVGDKASMWFDVPPGRKAFSVVATGSANQCVDIDVFDPSGNHRFGHPKVNAWTSVNSEGPIEPGLWRVEFSRPKDVPFWFFRYDISGVPGYFFLSPGKYWSLPVEYIPENMLH